MSLVDKHQGDEPEERTKIEVAEHPLVVVRQALLQPLPHKNNPYQQYEDALALLKPFEERIKKFSKANVEAVMMELEHGGLASAVFNLSSQDRADVKVSVDQIGVDLPEDKTLVLLPGSQVMFVGQYAAGRIFNYSTNNATVGTHLKGAAIVNFSDVPIIGFCSERGSILNLANNKAVPSQCDATVVTVRPESQADAVQEVLIQQKVETYSRLGEYLRRNARNLRYTFSMQRDRNGSWTIAPENRSADFAPKDEEYKRGLERDSTVLGRMLVTARKYLTSAPLEKVVDYDYDVLLSNATRRTLSIAECMYMLRGGKQ